MLFQGHLDWLEMHPQSKLQSKTAVFTSRLRQPATVGLVTHLLGRREHHSSCPLACKKWVCGRLKATKSCTAVSGCLDSVSAFVQAKPCDMDTKSHNCNNTLSLQPLRNSLLLCKRQSSQLLHDIKALHHLQSGHTSTHLTSASPVSNHWPA